jgi:hypothetical protein
MPLEGIKRACSSSSSSAPYTSTVRPLLDIGLPTFCHFVRSSATRIHLSSRPAQIVTSLGLRVSYITFTETWSSLQNSFTLTVVGCTADMASPPPPLQRANTICSMVALVFCRITSFRMRSRRETPSIALSIAR